MPHFLQGMKRSYYLTWLDERSLRAWERRGYQRMGLKDRLEENRWVNPRRREFYRKRVYPGYFS